MADISKNIRKLRMKRDLSQEQLAEQIGVTRQTISSWERGASFPDLGMLEKLTSALGTDLQHLLDPNAVSGRKGRRVESLGYGFIVLAVIVYVIAYILLDVTFEPLFGNAAPIIVAVLLFVVLIAFCTCLIMKHISDCTAASDKAEEDDSEDGE